MHGKVIITYLEKGEKNKARHKKLQKKLRHEIAVKNEIYIEKLQNRKYPIYRSV